MAAGVSRTIDDGTRFRDAAPTVTRARDHYSGAATSFRTCWLDGGACELASNSCIVSSSPPLPCSCVQSAPALRTTPGSPATRLCMPRQARHLVLAATAPARWCSGALALVSASALALRLEQEPQRSGMTAEGEEPPRGETSRGTASVRQLASASRGYSIAAGMHIIRRTRRAALIPRPRPCLRLHSCSISRRCAT